MSPKTYTPELFASTNFDYLIVGGGTAGLVVAARLSEDPDIVVGVLEAGPPVFDEPLVNVPGKIGQLVGTKYDWSSATTPQAGLNGRQVPWPRGKMLGGTSAMNFMVWNRGAKEDYDAWEELGNPGWNWENLKHYFQKSETLKAPPKENEQEFRLKHKVLDHGDAGPVKTSYQPSFAETHKYWHSTLENLKVETNAEHFGGSNIGAWTTVTCVDSDTQTRSYSASAYYEPFTSRKNYIVLTEAQTTEIILEKHQRSDDLIAKGVKFIGVQGQHLSAYCSREVIVCAGTVGSPQLLELSGIGSANILGAAGITPKLVNANVGENLQEHMMTVAIYELHPDIQTPEDFADPDFAKAAEELYKNTRQGILTATPGSIAYLPLHRLASKSEVSKLAQQASSYAVSSNHSSNSRHAAQNQILARQFGPTASLGQVEYILDHGNKSPSFVSVPGKKYASLMQALQYPYTRGKIHIDPTSAKDKVLIDPQYYQGEGMLDFAVMAKAQAFGDTITKTAPLNSIILRRAYPPPAGEGEMDWESWLAENTVTDWHPIGTCAMLPREKGGVVDHTLKVYGTGNVRVVDASVFPLHVSAHIQATIYAVAEKAADLIKESWRESMNSRL
ncbi:Dehydrogenase [Lachnellula occidentalis]|uniref:Dehydrogenase n=1 Tax=Lachnellula occidentalis TaxID=215460 RepID=A0A8H8UC72_9HELO|nr:Dehydrogenase [Lachnellula occidentalis]